MPFQLLEPLEPLKPLKVFLGSFVHFDDLIIFFEILTNSKFSSSSSFEFEELKDDHSYSTTWTMSLKASPLEDSFFVDAPPSSFFKLKGLKVSSFLPLGVLGSFLTKLAWLPLPIWPTSWPCEFIL